jgi:hypothetical protein
VALENLLKTHVNGEIAVKPRLFNFTLEAYRLKILSMNKAFLAQHILALEPQKNQGRQAFYHYLKNLCDLNSGIELEDFDAFYDLAMTYRHWWSARAELGMLVNDDMIALAKRYSLRFDVGQMVHPHEVQWMELERESDFYALLDDESEAYKKNDFDIKLVPLSKNEVLRIRYNRKTGGLVAEVKINLAFVDGIRLRLVRPVTRLEYSPDLELAEGVLQMLRVNGVTLASFRVVDGLMKGHQLIGHTFAKGEGICEEYRSGDEFCRVLKGIESHFINPISDYDYQEVVAQLRHAIERLKNLQSDGLQKGIEALRVGRSTMKDLFPNDKLLHSLVTTLEYYTQTRTRGEDQSCQVIRPLPPFA